MAIAKPIAGIDIDIVAIRRGQQSALRKGAPFFAMQNFPHGG
jgi:hypothetical protein